MPALTFAGVVKFEITIDEIVQSTRLILKKTKNNKVKAALKAMLKELKKGNASLVRTVFIPLYEIDSQQVFDKKFGSIRTKFKKMYLNQRPVLAKIHCWKITKKLKALEESQNWKKHIPGFRRSILRLELFTNQWIANDNALYEADEKLLKEINEFMDEIDSLRKNPKKAFSKLRSRLAEFEDNYIALRNKFAELEVLSSEI